MLKRLRGVIITLLMRRSFHNDDELYLYLIAYVANAFCLAAHTFHFALFLFNQLWLMAVINVLGAVLYLCFFRLIQTRHYTVASLLIAFGVTAYATFFSAAVGVSTYAVGFYLFVMIMQILVPYGTQKMRRGVIGASLLTLTVSVLRFVGAEPYLQLTPGLYKVVVISNIYITFLGVMIELYTMDVIKRIIASLNEKRLDDVKSQLYSDPLTGLYNRRYADSFFQNMAVSPLNQPACVAMLDIDDFKEVNDTYGHACGDEVLQFLAEFLTGNLRRTDTVFRWGGEEFLIVLELVDLHHAHRILEKLRAQLEQTAIPTKQGERNITVTVGISLLQGDAPHHSIEISDNRLYYGKRSGKNKVVMTEM